MSQSAARKGGNWMPDKTTDEKLVEAVATLGGNVSALTHNVIKLNEALTGVIEKLEALSKKLDARP
jgi:hypothetical protein